MITAIIQARMQATRLPNKVLLLLGKKTVLENVIGRVKQANLVNKIVVATSTEIADDQIYNLCKKIKVDCFRGSLNDVLDRYYQAALQYNATDICRITSDCPLIDPKVIDQVIEIYLSKRYDFVSNSHPVATYPDGFDVWVFSFQALKKAWQDAKLPSEREHVTSYIWNNPNKFKIYNLKNKVDQSHYRLTIDEEKDYKLLKRIFSEVKDLTTENILRFLDNNQEIKNINQDIARDEGYRKSLAEDKKFMNKKNVEQSQKLWQEAKKIIPGGTQLLSKRAEQHLPENWPAYFKKAKGVEVWDLDGNKFIDMSFMGVGSCTLGYADDEVNKAVEEVIEAGNMSTLNSPEEVELANLLIKLHPWAGMVRYARTGGEAAAIAIRIARAYSRKDKVAICGYHGWHDWYLASNLSSEENLVGHLLPGLSPNGVPQSLINSALPFHYNNISELEEIIREHEIGVIIMEPSRHQEPKDNFLEKVKNIAKKINAVLIFDEISSGFRRTIGGVHLLYGINPDIAVLGKAISNGYPMAAVIGKKEIMTSAEDSFISSTYWTERVGPTAAIATIKKMIEQNVPEHLDKIGKIIAAGWRELAGKHKLNISIDGPMALVNFSFKYDNAQEIKTLFTQEMLKRGFLAALTVYISYSHKKEHIESYLKAVDEVFFIIAEAIKENKVNKLLEGPVAYSGFQRLT